MFVFLSENAGTILVGGVLLGLVAAIVAALARDRKKGGHPGCGSGCGNCPAAVDCRGKDLPDHKT
jgi:hypothetical protein